MEVSGQQPLLVRLPRVGLEQIVVNAVQNAVDAICSRRVEEPKLVGEIEVLVERDELGVTIEIKDNGIGLGIAHPETAFEAFMTTKPKDKGTGLGLYISRQIMLEVGGAISINPRSKPERGTVLTLRLPLDVVLSGNSEPVARLSEQAAA